MATQKPSIPKGTRDFSSEEVAKRNYIFSTIRKRFREHAFNEIETPSIENLSTLLGKYGDEGDRLLFKILNSGEYLKTVDALELSDKNYEKVTPQITEKGLRYDLTVPFARYVVQHRNELQLPFKRSQIQPVWRADRPQKGRYREFYQCDADVIGSDSLLYEAELIQILDEVYSDLGINVRIHLNNRKVLEGLAQTFDIQNITDFTIAIDKLDKIGWDGVTKELRDKGIAQNAIDQLQPILLSNEQTNQKINALRTLFQNNEIGLKGITELETVFDLIESMCIKNETILDLSLARGLSYYTGCILEVKCKDIVFGSISGGGRYDNLTGVFGVDGMSGVGISFGADRIYDVMMQLNLFPEQVLPKPKLFFINFGKAFVPQILSIMKEIRSYGIACDLYPEETKLKKQMNYASALGIHYVAFVGEEELENDVVKIKDMETGEQRSYSRPELIELLK